jgi:hypothetical protein
VTSEDDDWSTFLSREDVLGGLPARRASILLFAIESRTAQLVARSRRALATYLTERTAEQGERAFLDAMSEGRDLALQPTIQDLERYAPGVGVARAGRSARPGRAGPDDGCQVRAAGGRAPGITRVLGLGDPAVGERFQALHGAPITSIYTDPLPAGERWRWIRAVASARLETLPPFWTAFALTLTETVGAVILALPIAFAAVGPVAGVIVLAVLGAINILTIAAMAEAVARNGAVRYRRAYFGRMVGDYLGPAGHGDLDTRLLLLILVIQLVYFIGFAATLADATGVGEPVWVAALGLVLLIFLHRGGIGATVASALVVGMMTISLIGALAVLALP